MASRGGRRRQRPRFVITYLPTILLIEMPFVLLFILDRDKSEAASNASQKRKKSFVSDCFLTIGVMHRVLQKWGKIVQLKNIYKKCLA